MYELIYKNVKSLVINKIATIVIVNFACLLMNLCYAFFRLIVEAVLPEKHVC